MSGYGFVTASGQQWARRKGRAAIPEAFLPQFVMYKNPLGIQQEADRVSEDIQTFLVDHGFTGFHVPVYCRWFDLDHDRANDIDLEDPSPDPKTFETLEDFISRVHSAGGVVHLWAWGDEARTQTPSKWGLNGPADQRLQRYIAARLGPIPGWTMGYGFDLDEWVTDEQIKTWRDYMHSHMAWPHMLGGRHGDPNHGTDHVDVAVTDVREYKVSTLDPEIELDLDREKHFQEHPEPLTQIRNREEGRKTRVERRPELRDFYNENDPFTVTNKDRNKRLTTIEGLEDWEKAAFERALEEEKFVYFIDFKNIGGLPTPLPLRIENEDGSEDLMMIPAEIWRRNYKNVSKMLIRDQAMVSIELDPRHETADSDYENNHFPPKIRRSRIELFKQERKTKDMMADMLVKLKKAKTGGDEEDAKTVPLEKTNN